MTIGEPPVGDAALADVVDNRGMLCAQGILRLMRVLLRLPSGSVVKVLSTDRVAEQDYPAWCRNTGHTFLRHEHDQGVIVSFLRRRPA